jgi:hypothetical protein
VGLSCRAVTYLNLGWQGITELVRPIQRGELPSMDMPSRAAGYRAWLRPQLLRRRQRARRAVSCPGVRQDLIGGEALCLRSEQHSGTIGRSRIDDEQARH